MKEMFELILTVALATQGGGVDFYRFPLGSYETQAECREIGDAAIEVVKEPQVKAVIYDCKQS